MKYWIISDTHFGHEFLVNIGDRETGFEKKIQKQLSLLPEDDILIHLGDVCLWQDAKQHEDYIKPIPQKKILIIWNHDRKSYHWYLSNWWDFVCESITLIVCGKRILLTHIPTPTEGYINIHGHLHKNLHHAPTEWDCILYSCEFENYQPKTIEALLKKNGRI